MAGNGQCPLAWLLRRPQAPLRPPPLPRPPKPKPAENAPGSPRRTSWRARPGPPLPSLLRPSLTCGAVAKAQCAGRRRTAQNVKCWTHCSPDSSRLRFILGLAACVHPPAHVPGLSPWRGLASQQPMSSVGPHPPIDVLYLFFGLPKAAQQ